MSSPLEIDQLIVPLIDGNSIVDIACGWGKWGYLIRTCWYRTQQGSGNGFPRMLIGADIYLPSLKRVKKNNIYDDVVLCNASYLPFKDDSFDAAIAIEMIEHLSRTQGTAFLDEIERISHEAIISTPNNPAERSGTKGPEGFNPYDSHISKWTVKDFKSREYLVIGSGFSLNGLSIPVIKAIFSPLSYFIPVLGCYFVAVKKKRKPESLGYVLRRMYPL